VSRTPDYKQDPSGASRSPGSTASDVESVEDGARRSPTRRPLGIPLRLVAAILTKFGEARPRSKSCEIIDKV
jgi:hypothetical protein